MTGQVHHVGFTVADLERSVDFYTRVLGCRVEVRAERRADFAAELIGYPGLHMTLAHLRLPGDGSPLIELMQFIDPPTAPADIEPRQLGAGHVCLTVDDIVAEHARLKDAGVPGVGAPVRMGGPGAAWALYLRDPDGIVVQLLQPAAPAE